MRTVWEHTHTPLLTMSGRWIAAACAGLVVAAVVITIIVVGDADKRHHPRGFVHPGPSPEARAVKDALDAAGGGPGAFTCMTYDAAVGEEVKDAQECRLCIDGEPRLDGEISACFCGAGDAEVAEPEDALLLTALEDLGYELEKDGGRVLRRGDFDAEQCHEAICDGMPPCAALNELQARLCDGDGEPRYESATAECVCFNDPMPPPPACVPDLVVPLRANGTVVGTLEVNQQEEELELATNLPGLCLQEPHVYIGATRASPFQQYPDLPGTYPTRNWDLDILLEADGEGPARFQIEATGEYPPEWNHPDAPTFECGHVLYLQWRALVAPQGAGGVCPARTASTWVLASSAPREFTYRYCCP